MVSSLVRFPQKEADSDYQFTTRKETNTPQQHQQILHYSYIQEARKELLQNGLLYQKFSIENPYWLTFATMVTGSFLIEQHNGSLIDVIKTVPGKERLPDSAGGGLIPPHTDNPDAQSPPQYLGLRGVTAGKTKVKTGLTHVEDLLRNCLSEKEVEILKTTPIEFMSKDGKQKVYKPVFSSSRFGTILMRYSENIILRRHPSPDLSLPIKEINSELKSICQKINQYCNERPTYELELQQGDLLIVNNHVFLHCRTAVNDYDRELNRIWLS